MHPRRYSAMPSPASQPWQSELRTQKPAARSSVRSARPRRLKPTRRPPPKPRSTRSSGSSDGDDGADLKRALLRQSSDELARAAAIERAELECICRAEARAERNPVLRQPDEWEQPALPPPASSSDDEDDPDAGVAATTPFLSPHRGPTSAHEAEWDELWDSSVAAALPSAAARERRRSANGQRARADFRSTAALLRASRGDARAPVPTSSLGRTSSEHDASLVSALASRVATAERQLQARGSGGKQQQRRAQRWYMEELRRTRSAGSTQESAAAIGRVARSSLSRVVSIELAQEADEQEEMWRRQRLQRRRREQQQQLLRTQSAPGDAEASAGGWLGSSPPQVPQRRPPNPSASESSARPANARMKDPMTRAPEPEPEPETEPEPTVSSPRWPNNPYRSQFEPQGGTPPADDAAATTAARNFVSDEPEHHPVSDNSDDGMHVEPAAAVDLQRCPSGHLLTVFETPEKGYSCDLCQTIVETGDRMRSCRTCEHDVCEACAHKFVPATAGDSGAEVQRIITSSGSGSGSQRSMLDEVAANDFPFGLNSLVFDANEDSGAGGGRGRKQAERSGRLIERVVALLVVVFVALSSVDLGGLLAMLLGDASGTTTVADDDAVGAVGDF